MLTNLVMMKTYNKMHVGYRVKNGMGNKRYRAKMEVFEELIWLNKAQVHCLCLEL